MSAHTPGPWVVQGRHLTEISGPQGTYIIANIDGTPTDPGSYATAQADARLIAAAPDLLAALREAEAELRVHYPEGKALPLVRAAIAKAEGR